MAPIPFLLAAATALFLAVPPDDPARATGQVRNGRQNQLEVSPPRLDEASLRMDARLDEPQWQQAAVLTGFSQFAPLDGIAAEDSTEVLVWYSATAVHFGIRAFEPHAAVHAALGDRDKIFSDDRVELLIGTFNDGRQAIVLGVNPLGVQMDGTLVENNQARAADRGARRTAASFPT